MYSEPNRAFGYAVLASIVLHGMLLFGVAQPRPRVALVEPVFPPIVARLAEPPVVQEPVAIPPEAKPPPVAEVPKPKPKPVQRPKVRAPKPLVKPVPEPAPELPAVAATPEGPPEQAPPPPLIARTDPAPAAPALPAPPPVVEAVPDSVTLAQYRSELLNAARKYKRYPRVAMENNWEGQVVVRLAVGPNGALAGLTVQSSSGHKLLDQQALEMFRRAATAVQVPPALRGREFNLEVRAVYNLTDQDSG
jgi:protein TonB